MCKLFNIKVLRQSKQYAYIKTISAKYKNFIITENTFIESESLKTEADYQVPHLFLSHHRSRTIGSKQTIYRQRLYPRDYHIFGFHLDLNMKSF